MLPALLRGDAGRRRTPRRPRGEVHRRRGRGGLRDPAGCTRTMRCARFAPQSRCGSASRRSNEELERDRGVDLAVRIGVTTGEVARRRPVERPAPRSGDTMNTAARLQPAAAPGEILIGDADLPSRPGRRASPSRSSRSRSRARPNRCRRTGCSRSHRSRRCAPATWMRRWSGADRERVAARAGVRTRRVRSRLPAVHGARVAPAPASPVWSRSSSRGSPKAVVLRGRCLPYGEGITYFPVVEAMKEALGIADFDDESSVGERIHAARRRPGPRRHDRGEPRPSCSAPVRAGRPEETFWAIRRFLEARGRDRPVVVVFDDIHWGEPTFLDLVEHIADWSRDAADPAAVHGAARAARRTGRAGPAGRRTRRRSRSRPSRRPSAPS